MKFRNLYVKLFISILFILIALQVYFCKISPASS
jgi:hypothetical protein